MTDPADAVAGAFRRAADTAEVADVAGPGRAMGEPGYDAVPGTTADPGFPAGATDEAAVLGEFCDAGLWPGMGPARWEQCAAAGMTSAGAVSEQALAALPGISAKQAKKLYSAWVDAAPRYELAMVLVPHDLPVRWVRQLADELGADPAASLTANPWQLLVVGRATVAQADRLARSLQPTVRGDDPRRAAALTQWVLRRHARDGHTASPLEAVAQGLQPYGFTGEDAQRAAVGAAVVAGLAARVDDPTDAGGAWLAQAELARAEESVARHVARLESAARPLATDHRARTAAAGLDGTQQGAVVAAARHGVSLLTGGPGTGKSRTVTAVVAMCDAAGCSVALAAPTGRAAKRLSELLTDAGTEGAQAVTIHRLLGARPVGPGGRSVFEHDESEPIDAEMIVIDETSMLDVSLAAALLAAVADGAHVLLVGDPAQLPSIGPGQVLGDLLAADVFPVRELTTVYRHADGGAIARLATAVRGGELARPDPHDHEVAVVPADDSTVAARRVEQLLTDSIPRVFGLSGEQVQVVTPIHRGPAGTKELNRMLKQRLNPGPHPGRTIRGFDVGDRVVATANYATAEPTGYANGEVGTVIDTTSKSVTVSFPGGESEISGKALADLVHGWAITVHRAQGSEWDAVVVVVPREVGRMLSRPLVYTAFTRARAHLSVVTASGPVLARAVRHIGARPRRTRLASLLAGAASR